MYQYPDREKLVTGCSYIGNEMSSILTDTGTGRRYSFEDCIKSHIKYLDGWVVLDDSTDGTTNILKEYATKLVPMGDRPFNTGAMRNELLSWVPTPWAWFFFADELVDTSLTVEEIREFINNKNHLDIIRLRRWNTMGKGQRQGYQYPDYQGNILKPTVKYSLGFHEMPSGKGINVGEEVPWRILHLFRKTDGDDRPTNRWDTFNRWHHQRYYTKEATENG